MPHRFYVWMSECFYLAVCVWLRNLYPFHYCYVVKLNPKIFYMGLPRCVCYLCAVPMFSLIRFTVVVIGLLFLFVLDQMNGWWVCVCVSVYAGNYSYHTEPNKTKKTPFNSTYNTCIRTQQIHSHAPYTLPKKKQSRVLQMKYWEPIFFFCICLIFFLFRYTFAHWKSRICIHLCTFYLSVFFFRFWYLVFFFISNCSLNHDRNHFTHNSHIPIHLAVCVCVH